MLLCLNVVEFVRREIDEIVRYLPDQKIRLPLQLSLLCGGSRPKSARASPQQCVHSAVLILSKSVHFWWSYSRTRERRFCPVEYFHNSLEAMLRCGRIITQIKRRLYLTTEISHAY